MRIILKAYFLVGILIAAAAVNLVLLYQAQQESTDESYTIIRASDLKAKVETISGLAKSIANGNDDDKSNLMNEINEFDSALQTLQTGGTIRGQTVVTVPTEIISDYNKVVTSWKKYRQNAAQIETSSVFDKQAVSSLNYIIEKNGEMALATDSVVKELEE